MNRAANLEVAADLKSAANCGFSAAGRRRFTVAAFGGIAAMLLCVCGLRAGAADGPAAPARIEARSPDYVLVALVQGGRMSVHVSSVIDNAPVRDAALAVVLRGKTHPALAQPDGGYVVEAPDLNLPGAATVEFRLTRGSVVASLRGTLEAAALAPRDEDQNGLRQYAWWVLNFGVCIGALMLYRRRSKHADD